MSDLLRHFFTAMGLQGRRDEFAPPAAPGRRAHRSTIATNRSTTVFSGEVDEWVRHLRTPWKSRADGVFAFEIGINSSARTIEFLPRNERSRPWADALTRTFRQTAARLEKIPAAAAVFNRMVFDNPSNLGEPLTMVSCADLPAAAAREMRVNDDLTPGGTWILVRTGLLEEFEARGAEDGKPMERAGEIWEVIRQILLQIGHERYPRDRFTERIELTAKWALVNLHMLYDGKKDGRPDANPAGEAFEKISAKRGKIDRRDLFARDPFFRLLGDLSFLLRDRAIESLWDTAAVIVRDYLDSRYLRLSIAGLMPDKPEWLEAMPVEWKSPKKIRTPVPEVGRYGLIDDEDEDAWKQVRGPLEDAGYLIVGQLGMGQFGRVYEALNVGNGSIPARVAVKVDRIRKGHKKEAIEAADTIMEIARGLAKSPHVIRVFDAGYLKKIRSNYHILQIVEGDTLDHLIGVAGSEHASILRPQSGRSSQADASREFLKSLSGSAGEAWRRNRKSPPFVAPPGLGHILDILTSKALWIEEVHSLGFAVNDLKNGNVMMSRRGQFKAIDLDSYSRVFSHLDKLPDFFFLAISTLQLVTRGCAWEQSATTSEIKGLLSNPGAIAERLRQAWPYGDLAAASGGRLTTEEMIGFFARFIDDARGGSFANDQDRFTKAIDALIFLKRRLSTEEMVLQ